jgi:phosphoribosylformylglycinamidine synthase
MLFGEDQARYLLATNAPEAILGRAGSVGVPVHPIGAMGGETIRVEGLFELRLTHLRTAHESWLPAFMA